MKLHFDPKNNQRYGLPYLSNRTFVCTQRGHDLQGEVVIVFPYDNNFLIQAKDKLSKSYNIDRTEFLSMQWLSEETFPEYYL